MFLNRYDRPQINAPFCPIEASDLKRTFLKGLCRTAILGIGILSSVLFGPAFAGEADVTEVVVTAGPNGTYRFDVTVQHADTGWDHYADKWEVVLPDGTIAATRTLYHPHVNEQPFTRSQSGVKVPEGIVSVTIQAHDSVHEYGGRTQEIQLP